MSSKAIYARLTADTAATRAIAEGRVYPASAVQDGERPYVVYEVESQPLRTSTTQGGLWEATATITAVAPTYEEAHGLMLAIVGDLENQAGTWGGVVVQGAFVDGVSEGLEGEPEFPRHVQILTVRMFFNQ